jgi:1-deoxyxylulose-5-phosphate synthase
MRYVNLGSSGLRVSRVCLGMMSYGRHESRQWALDEAAAEPIVRRAVEGGVTFFDTADVYNGGQSEVVTGRLLGKLFGTREEYVVATKVHGRTMPGETRWPAGCWPAASARAASGGPPGAPPTPSSTRCTGPTSTSR